MKSDIGRAVVVTLSILMLGCSSIRARTEFLDKDWTVYPGVQQDVKEMGDIFSGKSPEPDWIDGLITSILVADLPFSAVFDTVAMPYDLYRIYNPEEFSGKGEASKNSSGGPKTGEER